MRPFILGCDVAHVLSCPVVRHVRELVTTSSSEEILTTAQVDTDVSEHLQMVTVVSSEQIVSFGTMLLLFGRFKNDCT